jgi:hypothetical protein
MFKMDGRNVTAKLLPLKPCGKRGRYDIYLIREAAQYLVKPVGDFETFLRNAHFSELPNALRKEFWAAQRMKQIVEKEAGDLWPTEDVIEPFRLRPDRCGRKLLLLGDAVEREVSLPDKRARELLRHMIDAAMESMRERLVEKYISPTQEKLAKEAAEISDDGFFGEPNAARSPTIDPDL